jgi:hypothetical protein
MVRRRESDEVFEMCFVPLDNGDIWPPQIPLIAARVVL